MESSARLDNSHDSAAGTVDPGSAGGEEPSGQEGVMQCALNRRRVLATLSSAGVVGLIGTRNSFAEEAPPETTRLRLIQVPSICMAAQYVAEELLRGEGFTDVQYIKKPGAKGIETA